LVGWDGNLQHKTTQTIINNTANPKNIKLEKAQRLLPRLLPGHLAACGYTWTHHIGSISKDGGPHSSGDGISGDMAEVYFYFLWSESKYRLLPSEKHAAVMM